MIDHLDSPEKIEREIEQTRRKVGRDIDELGERLSPRRLKRRAGPVLAIAAVGVCGLWLLRRSNRRRIAGPMRAAVTWLIANPTVLTTGVSVLIGLLVPANRRRESRHLMNDGHKLD
jgi:hypothetical protein